MAKPRKGRQAKPVARAGGVGWLAGGAALLVAGVLLGRAWLMPDLGPVSLETANVKGNPTAAVELEEWGDFG
jgi:hypothetical protein